MVALLFIPDRNKDKYYYHVLEEVHLIDELLFYIFFPLLHNLKFRLPCQLSHTGALHVGFIGLALTRRRWGVGSKQ